jgi:hypothetical protein
MKKGGTNLKYKEIKIPIKVVKEEGERAPEETEKEKKPKALSPDSPLRIVRDKDNLPVFDGAIFEKIKVKKKAIEKTSNSRKKAEPEKARKKIEPAVRKEEHEKEQKKDKKQNNISNVKKQKILVISVVGIASIIIFIWAIAIKSNIAHSLDVKGESIFSSGDDFKSSFEGIKNKLEALSSSLKQKGESSDSKTETQTTEEEIQAPKDEAGASGDNVLDKVKEKILIEEIKNKVEGEK